MIAERHDQTLAPADAVDIGAEHDGADRAHQRAEPEHAERIQQRRRFVLGRKERLRDGAGVKAEQEEIELFEEIAAGRAQDGADTRFDLRYFRTTCLRHDAVSPAVLPPAQKASLAETVSLLGCDNLAQLARRDQPAKRGRCPENAECRVFQGLFCTDATSHCRNADSFGGSVRPAGETR